MLQSAGIPDRLRVGEVLALVRSYYRDPRSVADCVALAGLDGLMERPYRQLSGGQQRRVQFAIAVCGQRIFLPTWPNATKPDLMLCPNLRGWTRRAT